MIVKPVFEGKLKKLDSSEFWFQFMGSLSTYFYLDKLLILSDVFFEKWSYLLQDKMTHTYDLVVQRHA